MFWKQEQLLALNEAHRRVLTRLNSTASEATPITAATDREELLLKHGLVRGLREAIAEIVSLIGETEAEDDEGNEEHVHECGNCRKQWKYEDLDPIADLSQRIEPGSEVPSGECPMNAGGCGALCYPLDGYADDDEPIKVANV